MPNNNEQSQPHGAAKPQRAAIYLRVATSRQAKAYGLDRQRETCKAYLNQHGMELVGVYTDVASGSVRRRKLTYY